MGVDYKMKKELIAYILALTTITGCNDLKKKDENIVETFTKPNTNIEVIDDAYYSHSDSMSYGSNLETEYSNEELDKDKIIQQEDTGKFYLVNYITFVYDKLGNVIQILEKYEKVLLINDNIINEYAYIQLSNGQRGYVYFNDLTKITDEEINLNHEYVFNSFNDTNQKINNDNKSIQPPVYKFAKENTILYDIEGNVIQNIEKYDIILMINLSNETAYIELTNGTRGYVNNNLLERLPESFIEVDISEQTLYAHNNNEIVLKANVVTGNPNIGTIPGTNLGYTEVNGTAYNTKLMNDAPADIFISFNEQGEGFHDARWRTTFGGEIYKTNGSHGCVNMKLEDVKILDKYAEYGTKVLIHK